MNLRNRIERIVILFLVIAASAATLAAIWREPLPAQPRRSYFTLPNNTTPNEVLASLKAHVQELSKRTQIIKEGAVLTAEQRIRVEEIKMFLARIDKELRAQGKHLTPLTTLGRLERSEFISWLGRCRLRIHGVEVEHMQTVRRTIIGLHERGNTIEREKLLASIRPTEKQKRRLEILRRQRMEIENIEIPSTPASIERNRRIGNSYLALILIGMFGFIILTMLGGERVILRFFANPTDLLKLLIPGVAVWGIITWSTSARARFQQRCTDQRWAAWNPAIFDQREQSLFEKTLALKRALLARIVSVTVNSLTAVLSLTGVGVPALAFAKKATSQPKKKSGPEERQERRTPETTIPISASIAGFGTFTKSGLQLSARIHVNANVYSPLNLKVETMACVDGNVFFPGAGVSMAPWTWFATALLARYRLVMNGEWQQGWDIEWRLQLTFTSYIKAWLMNYLWVNPANTTLSGLHLWRIQPLKRIPLWIGFHGEWSANQAEPTKSMIDVGGFIGISNWGVTVLCNPAQHARDGCKIVLEYATAL